MVRGTGMLNFRLLVWAKSGDKESLRQALETNAQCNVDYTSVKGETPVWAAAKNGYADIVNMLVERGANVNIPDKAGKSPRDLLPADCDPSLRSALEAAEAAQHFVPSQPSDKPPAPSARKARGGGTGARGRGRAAASTTHLPLSAPPTHPATRTHPPAPPAEPGTQPATSPPEPAPAPTPATEPPPSPPPAQPQPAPTQPPPAPATEHTPTAIPPPAQPQPPPPPPLHVPAPPQPPPPPAPPSHRPPSPAPVAPVPPSPPSLKRPLDISSVGSSKKQRADGSGEAQDTASRQQTVDKLRRSRLLLLRRWREGLGRGAGAGKGRLEGTGIRKMAGEGQQGGWGYWCCVCGLGLAGLQQADAHLDSGTHTEATLRDLAQRTATGVGGQQVLENTVSAYHVAVCASQSDIEGLTGAVVTARALVERQGVWACTGHRVVSARAAGALARQTLLRGETVGGLLVVVDPKPTASLAGSLAKALGASLAQGQTAAVHGPFSVAVRLPSHTVICLLVSEPYLKGSALEDDVHEEQRAEGRRLDAFEYFAAEAQTLHGNNGPTVLRSLVQVLRSVQRRPPCYPAWDRIKTWSLELLAAYTVLTAPRLSLADCLRSALSHMAGGFFLPGGVALSDPCSDRQGERECTCSYLSASHSEAVTAVAQDLSRSLSLPRTDHLKWLQPGNPPACAAGTVWTHL